MHEFAGESALTQLCLTARARQFSCFMVVLGRMGAHGTFEPSHAMIARNKDELRLPLLERVERGSKRRLGARAAAMRGDKHDALVGRSGGRGEGCDARKMRWRRCTGREPCEQPRKLGGTRRE